MKVISKECQANVSLHDLLRSPFPLLQLPEVFTTSVIALQHKASTLRPPMSLTTAPKTTAPVCLGHGSRYGLLRHGNSSANCKSTLDAFLAAYAST